MRMSPVHASGHRLLFLVGLATLGLASAELGCSCATRSSAPSSEAVPASTVFADSESAKTADDKAKGFSGAAPAAAPAPESQASPASRGGIQSGAPAPAKVEAPREEANSLEQVEPQTLAQAEKALAQAESELTLALNGGTSPGASPSSPRAEGKRSAELATRDCSTVCRAFESLKRASQAICRLAGDSDGRCTRARSTVTTQQSRVASCGCQSG